MSSYSKTELLGLNNWSASDRPMRNDFNSDNLIIDEVLGGHIEDTDMHLTSAEKTRVSRPIVISAYSGDGSAERTVTLSVAPLGVIVYREGMPSVYFDSTRGCNKVYSSVAFLGAQATSGLSLAGNTLTVRQDTSAEGGVMCCLNESGVQYKVIIIA